MPTYEFRCPQGHDFEKFYRTISGAEAQAACPICGEPAERVMSATGFAFKGSGFYLTDYGKNAHRKGGSDMSGSSSGGESSASSGDSAKSDATSATAPKSDSPSTPKTDTAKTTDSKPSGKTKGGDSK